MSRHDLILSRTGYFTVRAAGLALLLCCAAAFAQEGNEPAPQSQWGDDSAAIAAQGEALESHAVEGMPRQSPDQGRSSTNGGGQPPTKEKPARSISRAAVGLSIVSSSPPSCAIDARQPHEPTSASALQGWNSVDLTFSSDPSGLTVSDFTVSVSPAGPPAPAIFSIQALGGNVVRLTFNIRIPVQKWTKVTHTASGTNVSLGHLPGDIDSNGFTAPADLVALIDALNGITSLPIYRTDMNRSGLLEPSDFRRAVEIINGCDAFSPWNGVSLTVCPSP